MRVVTGGAAADPVGDGWIMSVRAGLPSIRKHTYQNIADSEVPNEASQIVFRAAQTANARAARLRVVTGGGSRRRWLDHVSEGWITVHPAITDIIADGRRGCGPALPAPPRQAFASVHIQ
jgi:hypothetical protein